MAGPSGPSTVPLTWPVAPSTVKASAPSPMPAVDCVSGVGYDRARAAGPAAERFHEIRVVISNLGVFDFETPDHAMRLRSLHPGVEVDEVVEATGFALVVPDDVPTSRLPDADELELIREVLDPTRLREKELPS